MVLVCAGCIKGATEGLEFDGTRFRDKDVRGQQLLNLAKKPGLG